MMHHELEILRAGDEAADTLLLIHDINPISHTAPFIGGLARSRYIVAPSHPGFGASPLPADFDTMYDLVNLYLDVLDNLDSDRIAVAGFGFGGWIAAELAVAGHRKLDRLVLVDALGIKLAARDERDFPHLFNTNPADLLRLAWHDPAARPAGIHGVGWQATISDEMTDADLVTLARNWDSLCLFAWRPHMFNPQLKHWLHRIRVPTLVLWGESDGIVTPDYGRRYADLIPGSIFETIPNAGHHPEMEQPTAFVAAVERFLS
ncbi:MAG TPA: alpha/beta hydrolase [Acetobacteraceae bacterium]|jgi:pimeloyl-ACP methyl ester carboxylesterase|nr:alpha/beta hydrolase [Acetobacteraceae bacterium]